MRICITGCAPHMLTIFKEMFLEEAFLRLDSGLKILLFKEKKNKKENNLDGLKTYPC